MFHQPAAKGKPDNAIGYKSKLGIFMFIIYAVIYAGFVVVNVARPTLMEKHFIFGLNIAVVYGFGLIVFALILALIYNHLCTMREKHPAQNGAKGGHK
ncbi:MAG: hypothetical protein A2Y10_09570 [Planctomycetes bacterium GWF2_41_51]|nr:MAG: hypothetical protein A2Y10_09570 [Planctomycetes bacterium GWF2_41_51]